jgi:hypothetical protein
MRCVVRLMVVFFASGLLLACGGAEEKDGLSLQVGQLYRMTEKGLEPVPHLTDKAGAPLVSGQEYLMTPQGLEPIPYLKDKEGNRVDIGNEYVMTGQGLKLVLSRGIKGALLDSAGKPLPDVEVVVLDSDYKATTRADGSFTLPFIEGYVRLAFKAADLPQWCSIKEIENPSVSRETHPNGWDIGIIRLPCIQMAKTNSRTAWATASGEYVDNGDGTVSDLKHGLIWEAAVGQHRMSWNSAEQYAANLELAGHSDWRLPSPEELKVLYEAGIACPWNGPTLVTGALSLWSSQQLEGPSALVFNICSGKSRQSGSLDEGPNVNPDVLAVRSIK